MYIIIIFFFCNGYFLFILWQVSLSDSKVNANICAFVSLGKVHNSVFEVILLNG